MLRSQDGVEEVLNPYGNLKQGIIEIRTSAEKAPDFKKLIERLENEIGFEPVREVALTVRGTVRREKGAAKLVGHRTGQSFKIDEQKAESGKLPLDRLITASAVIRDTKKPDSVVILRWEAAGPEPGQPKKE